MHDHQTRLQGLRDIAQAITDYTAELSPDISISGRACKSCGVSRRPDRSPTQIIDDNIRMELYRVYCNLSNAIRVAEEKPV